MPVTVSASGSKKVKTSVVPEKSGVTPARKSERPKRWGEDLAKIAKVSTSAFAVASVASRSLSAFRRSEKPIPGDCVADLMKQAKELEEQAGYAKEEADLRLRIANAKKVISEHKPSGVIHIPDAIKNHIGLITIIAVIMILLVFLNTC